MALKINTINVESGDYFIITHNGSAEVSLSITCFEDGVKVGGPMNSTRREYYFREKGVKEIGVKGEIKEAGKA